MGEMALAWSDRFLLGDKGVDNQHRKLFELLGEVVEQCQDGSNVEKLSDTLEFLVDYTVHHFYDEESLQVQYNYPEYRSHKQMHEDFKATVGTIVTNFEADGSSEELSNAVNIIVAKWLVNHISREDKKVGLFLREAKKR